ncbi:MAG TPA: amidase [Marmoricola sp.]|nr:amidase [Marmoricola sp.]
MHQGGGDGKTSETSAVPSQATRSVRSVHAFGDDALGGHDATALTELVQSRQVSPRELASAAVARANRMQPFVNGVHYPDYERAVAEADGHADGLLGGVPTYVKDNVDVAGLPTNHGTDAFTARAAKRDSPFVTQLRACGMTILGKSRLPEFGFSASTEYPRGEPVRNPWHLDYSAGASSGGSAALVASGVVPIAHANDGGGSIRIPAAVCGLVGLKPTRGRLVDDPLDRQMPVRIVSQGVLTRSVRDTARFLAAAEAFRRSAKLPPTRYVEGPSRTRLRVGLVLSSVTGTPTDAETRRAVLDTAALLEHLGHRVEETTLPVSPSFAEDFARYWALLGLLAVTTGKALDRRFDVARTDNLTRGLAARSRRELLRTPQMVYRLRRTTARYRRAFQQFDVLLSPVLTHTTPLLGHLAPTLEFDELFTRLEAYVGFTPLNNAAGSPAMSLPLGTTTRGLPVGIHLSADLGDERTLLELAYELEEARPFPRIQDVAPPSAAAVVPRPREQYDAERQHGGERPVRRRTPAS